MLKVTKRRSGLLELDETTDLPVFSRPDFAQTMRLPKALYKLDVANLAELHYRLLQLYCYANERRAKAQAHVVKLEGALRLLAGTMMMESPRLAQLAKFQQTAILETDPRWRRLTQLLTTHKAELEMFSASAANYDKFMFVVNKELSRKQATGDDAYRMDRARR